jgi:(E)-4-hydroxy-3-methylbut-2-enyl-diphosphate synthase
MARNPDRIRRRRSRAVAIGGTVIGGANPVAVQSMAKTATGDVAGTVRQIRRLAGLGCEIVRVAVKDMRDAEAIAAIRKRIDIPLVADIHFDWKLAMAAIESGCDKIRLNPGNIRKRGEISEICRAAKRRGIPIRVGLNSGSIQQGGDQVAAMLAACREYVRLLESLKFREIVISLKCQNAPDTVRAYRQIAGWCRYPLHVGMTATGPSGAGMIKSSAAIGALLLEGIGDTIRVSLTDEPEAEVAAARELLQAVGARSFGPEVISCPTCGRCQVDLVKIVNELERKLQQIRAPAAKLTCGGTRSAARAGVAPVVQVAVMGCEVNGPGEARQAAIGVAFGKGHGLLFRRGKPVRKVAASECVDALLKEIRKL